MNRLNAWVVLSGSSKNPYDDVTGSHYSYTDKVANSLQVKAGDLLVVRQDSYAAGWGIVQYIEVLSTTRTNERCPACKRASIKIRTTKSPPYICESCRTEFDSGDLVITVDPVTEYRAHYGETWHEAARPVHFKKIEEFQLKGGRINAIRQLDMDKVQGLLDLMAGPSFDFTKLYSNQDLELITGGHQEVVTRRRHGQRQFRFEMLDRFGENCALSGRQPPQVLEAAHLYSYAEVGKHRIDGGLILRRDFHALFDGYFIAIDPSTWRVKADPYLRNYESYRTLDGAELQIANELRPNEHLLMNHFELTSRVIASRMR